MDELTKWPAPPPDRSYGFKGSYPTPETVRQAHDALDQPSLGAV